MSHPKGLFVHSRLSLTKWDFYPGFKVNAIPYRRSGLVDLPRGTVLSKHLLYSTTNGDTPVQNECHTIQKEWPTDLVGCPLSSLFGIQNSFLSISSAPGLGLSIGYICHVQGDFLH